MAVELRAIDKKHSYQVVKTLQVKSKKFTFRSVPVDFIFLKKCSRSLRVPFYQGRIMAQQYGIKLIPSQAKTIDGITFKGELRKHQEEPYQHALNNLKKHNTAFLCLYTGAGKTVVGISLAIRTKRVIAVITNRVNPLLNQWYNSFLKFSDAKIYCQGSSKLSNCTEDEANVFLLYRQRIIKLKPENRDRIGTVIIDEAHTFCSKNAATELLSLKPWYLILLTATPDKLDKTDKALTLLAGSDRIRLRYRGKFPVEIHETGIIPLRVKNEKGIPKWSVHVQSLLYSERRNQRILELVKRNQDWKILILTAENAHGFLLHRLLIDQAIDNDFYLGKKKSYRDSSVLIGTVPKIGTGFDEANSCDNFNNREIDLLIVTTSYRDPSVVEQYVGRVLRSDNPRVIYLLDDHPVNQKHFMIAHKWLISRGGKVTQIKQQKPSVQSFSCPKELKEHREHLDLIYQKNWNIKYEKDQELRK